MIRFGPSGIPLSCKGRTLRDGIEDVHTLGLTALEIQMVRANVEERYATDEDLKSGKTPRQFEEELIIEVKRGTGQKRRIVSLEEPLEKGDLIRRLVNPLGGVRDYEHLRQLGQIAKNLDVVLSIHTPYYIDLVANNDLTERSVESIRWAGIMAQAMDAQIVVTHMGMYGDMPKKAAIKNITDNIAGIQAWFDESGIKVLLGLETSGRQEIFGEFSEIEALCDQVKGPVPVINFPHVHARGNGALKRKEDFQDLFDRAGRFTKGRFYTHFSGVEHEGGNEIRYTPIKKGDLKFEPLAECILENDMELTVISGSPLLEHDAMYMKVILERVLSKREAKAERQKAKEAEAPEPAPAKGKKAEKKTAPKKAAKPAPKKAAPKPKPAAKKPAGKAPAKARPAPKPQAKKAAAKKPAPKPQPKKAPVKPAPKKAAPKPKPAAKKTAGKAPAKKPAQKPAPKKAPAKKPVPKKTAKPASKKAVKKPAQKPTPKKAAPKKAPAKKAPAASKAPAKKKK